jgi:hypothetical protein
LKQQFLNDLQKIYDYLTAKKQELGKMYEYLEKGVDEELKLVQSFADYLELEVTQELQLSLINRLVSLRDDSLLQVLKKLEFSQEQINVLQDKAYEFTKNFWLEQHQQTLEFINSNSLLTPFYREIFRGVYEVGVYMSNFALAWKKHIINEINPALLKEFGSNEKVLQYLEENDLFDKGHDGLVADRSYSVLIKTDDGYEVQAYIKAFKKEITAIVDAFEDFESNLIELEDDVFSQKWQFVLYIQSLMQAFSEDNRHRLVEKWAKVDEAWMDITAPLQMGHPLEYYEDHFRKAVAPEWDLRMVNPSLQTNNKRVEYIKSTFQNIFEDINDQKYKSIFDFSYDSLDKTQLYLGRPALFFGAGFNGLFSAQVVPNDETVSKLKGKKIFAFGDEVLESSRIKPLMKFPRVVFGDEFVEESRKFLFNETKKWHELYDISTIGHEYGHILWCDEETETLMNKTGNFKNIEEFKATTGGLVTFFYDEVEDLKLQILKDLIKRAVGLIAWMEVGEVEPYYCEGLIHLNGLFETKILQFENEQLKVDMNENKYQSIKQWYLKTYNNLAKHYLEKKDATLFLKQFATKENGKFLPKNETIKTFAHFYYKLYQEIGRELDSEDSKENYKEIDSL